MHVAHGRTRLAILMVLVLVAASMPGMLFHAKAQTGDETHVASWADGAGGGSGEFSAAFTEIEDFREGDIGAVETDGFDTPANPAGACATDTAVEPATMEIAVDYPVIHAAGATAQTLGLEVALFQYVPDSVNLFTPVYISDMEFVSVAAGASVDPGGFLVEGVPVGPTYLAVVGISWFDDTTIPPTEELTGFAAFWVDNYDVYLDGGFVGADFACFSFLEPSASLNPTSHIVNTRVTFNLQYFPIEVPFTTMWDARELTPTTTSTDLFGEASGTFNVPASPMGDHTVSFTAGEWQAATTFTVIPRIKITPGEAARGDLIDVSLRGYKARETVRIRWLRDGSWVELARVTTSGTGSANIDLDVPDWAPVGQNSVRGDSTNASGGRAQTNAFSVDDVPLPEPGTLVLSSNRGTVNSRVTATVGTFPPNELVVVTFRGFYEATASAMTDETGAATMTFKAPASPKGFYTVEATGGNVEATATYEIVPRIKLTPGQAARGESVGVSLRGYGARETVRIRWRIDGSFEQLTTVTTSGSGSANIDITVPLAAVDGAAAVRGDGPIGRAQTNAFVVSGGPFEPAAVEEPSPTPTATPTETPLASPTAEPTVTAEPTQEPEPTAAPTEEPPIDPTTTPETPPDPPIDPPAEPSPTSESTAESTT